MTNILVNLNLDESSKLEVDINCDMSVKQYNAIFEDLRAQDYVNYIDSLNDDVKELLNNMAERILTIMENQPSTDVFNKIRFEDVSEDELAREKLAEINNL